jgi:hypothetical protein
MPFYHFEGHFFYISEMIKFNILGQDNLDWF